MRVNLQLKSLKVRLRQFTLESVDAGALLCSEPARVSEVKAGRHTTKRNQFQRHFHRVPNWKDAIVVDPATQQVKDAEARGVHGRRGKQSVDNAGCRIQRD